MLKTRSRHITFVILTLSLTQAGVAGTTPPPPQTPQGLLSRGIDAATTGNYKKAIEHFDAAIQLDPRFAPAYYHRGLIRNRTPWIAAAPKPVEDFEMATRLNPEYAEAYVELGRARDEVRDFDRAIQINPNLPGAYYWRGRLREKQATNILTGQSVKLIRTSVADYERALNLDRRYAEAYLAKGRALRKLNENQMAVDHLTRAIQFLPRETEAYEERGLARLGLGDENGALEDFIQIIRLARTPSAITPPPAKTSEEQYKGDYTSHLNKLRSSPALAKAYFEEGMAYRYVGNQSELALASFTRAIELNLNTAAVFYQRGLLFLDQRKWNEAIEDLSRGIQLVPTQPEYYYSRGRAYFERGDYLKASLDFSESTRRSSKAGDVLYWRGRALYNLGDKAKAIADFSAAIAADPQAAVVYYWRGLAFEDVGETVRAAGDYIKVVEIRPLKNDEDRVDSRRAFAQIDYHRGRARLALINEQTSFEKDVDEAERQTYSGQAARDFSRYITASPAAAEAYFWRARAEKWLRQRDKAIADFTQAIRLRPSFVAAYLEHARFSASEGASDLSYVIRLRPEWARGYYERADHVRRSAMSPMEVNIQAALPDLNRAIELDPGLVEAYSFRAWIRAGRLNDSQGAIADLSQIIQHDPENVIAYRDRAYLRLEAKDYRGAIDDFSRSIELASGSRETTRNVLAAMYAGRSKARYEIGDGIGSHNDHQQADELAWRCGNCTGSSSLAKAKKADSVFQKGRSLALRGDTRQARLNFEEALRLYEAAGRMSDCEKAKYELSRL